MVCLPSSSGGGALSRRGGDDFDSVRRWTEEVVILLLWLIRVCRQVLVGTSVHCRMDTVLFDPVRPLFLLLSSGDGVSARWILVLHKNSGKTFCSISCVRWDRVLSLPCEWIPSLGSTSMAELSVAVLRVLLLRFGSSWSVEVEGGRRAKTVGSTADVLFSRTSCSLLFVYPSICFGCDGWRGDPVRGMEAMDAALRLGLEVEDDVWGSCCNFAFTQGLFCKTMMYCAHSQLI